MDAVSPKHPCRRIVLVKPTQSGGTEPVCSISSATRLTFPPGTKWGDGEGRRKSGPFALGGRISEILPHALLLRAFVLQGLIADELGPAGCLHTGFYEALQKMNAKLLWKIPNSKTRHRVFQRSSDMGNEEMIEYAKRAVEALKEVAAAARSGTKKNR